MGIEEERVRSPREGFGTNVEVIIVRRHGEVTIVFSLEVLLVLGVFGLNFLHPEVASRDCFVQVNSNLILAGTKSHLLAGRQP